MVKTELVQRSPVRLLEKIIEGGLKPGEIGVLAAPKGIGKTSVLVQIALDKLLQGKKIIHISFNQHASYVQTWYENLFEEITKKKQLENERDVADELVRNRVLMNFNQESVSTDVIRRSLKSMIVEGGFKADSIIIDGFNFSITGRDRISTFKDFAKELGISAWYSCDITNTRDCDKHGIPAVLKDFEDTIDVVIVLESKPAYTELRVSKEHGRYDIESIVHLDPKTLLILEN
ncbi:MAG: AAA family ATPase [Spirochaetaceae bacterium]|jgi:predicted ATP-dependent serine protease|nr:AAA family ATPase [Spirochaetaceae bacterium]